MAAMALASACGSSDAVGGTARCTSLTVTYSPTRVHTGQVFEDDLRVQNCSSAAERIVVKVRAHGPCSFPHPPSATYSFRAGHRVDQHATIIAPGCPGRYTVVARAYVKGAVTATSRAGFTVAKHRRIAVGS